MSSLVFRSFAVFALLAAGCGEEQPPDRHAERRSGFDTVQGNSNWLDALTKADPAVWLLERQSAAGESVDPARLRDLQQLLKKAASRFKEETRMIANHAVQLEQMLQTKGEGENAVWLIERLTDVVSEVGRIDGFGALGQQYYNLRNAGYSKQAALDELSRHYGSRS
jgi:hypothetical protein